MNKVSWPVIVVTGANAGVGFGICQRFLLQFLHRKPLDAQPQTFYPPQTQPTDDDGLGLCEGVTLIMACRNLKKAAVARAQMLATLDGQLDKLKRNQETAEGAKAYAYAFEFRRNVAVDVVEVDLASMTSVFACAESLSKKYPYISHLILNAGVVSFSHIDFWKVAQQWWSEGVLKVVSAPTYNVQHVGELSVDGLGWVWQCNVFGNYCLFRLLERLLASCPSSSLGPRVLWMSSMEAQSKFYDRADWQLKASQNSYEGSKYQIDLIATHLDQRAVAVAANSQPDSSKNVPRHFIVEPAVTATAIASALTNPLLDFIKLMLFYVVRWCGSVYHPIQPYKAAVSAVHVSLVSIGLLSAFLSPSQSRNDDSASTMYKLGARADFWGRDYVGLTEVEDWEKHKEEAVDLVMQCEALFQSFKNMSRQLPDFETASERM